MNYPQMLYKDGRRGAHYACKDTKEMVVAANEGFYPMGIDSVEKVYELPYVKADLDAEKKKKEEAVRVNKLLAVDVINVGIGNGIGMDTTPDAGTANDSDLIAKFEKETGKMAINDRGILKGKETKSFIAWKEQQ